MLPLLCRFNSIKVRLRLGSAHNFDFFATMFQFHKGAIKTPHRHMGRKPLFPRSSECKGTKIIGKNMSMWNNIKITGLRQHLCLIVFQHIKERKNVFLEPQYFDLGRHRQLLIGSCLSTSAPCRGSPCPYYNSFYS